MELKEIFEEYIHKSEQLIIAKRSMYEIAQNEINRLNQKKKKEKEIIGEKDSTHSMDFFYIKDIKTGEMTRYKHLSSTIDEKINQVMLQKNKQYQWILSESYEVFREYLIKCYAYIGYKDKNIWPLKDYGNIVLSELKDKDYLFFLEQAKIKKDIPDSIINKFRNIFPKYKDIEVCNKSVINLNLEINLIEHFRHLIVHCGGKTKDKSIIIEKILKKSGLWNNGKYTKHSHDYLSSFFKFKDSSYIIFLLEIDVDNKDGVHGGYYDILDDLLSSLTGIAFLIFNEAKVIVK